MLDSFAKTDPTQSDVVSFKVLDQDFCIDISAVKEIRGWTPTTVLPHAQRYVKGVINLRGSVVPVIDLATRLELGEIEDNPRNVIIIVMTGGHTIGLLADVVSDIVPVPGDALKPVPDVASETARNFIVGVITYEDGRILRKIDLSRLLPEIAAGRS